MLDENDFIKVNKIFPKEISVNGKSLLILYNAVKNFTKEKDNLEFQRLVVNLSEPLSINGGACEHFYIEVTRGKFVDPNIFITNIFNLTIAIPKNTDSYSERLCEVLAELPNVSSIMAIHPKITVFQLFEKLNSISSIFFKTRSFGKS